MVERAAQIRPLQLGQRSDQIALLEIYNHYVEHTHFTFDVAPFTLASRASWFEHFTDPIYHCVVACRDDMVVGYACSVPFKAKAAYRTSVEVSIYTAPDAATQGIGSQLYAALFDYLQAQPLHRIYAGIALPNEGSIALHEKFGFGKVAHFEEVGYKFNQYWDVAWYEKPV